MLGLLLYLTTVANVPHVFCLIPTIWALFFRRDTLSMNLTKNKQFIALIILFILGAFTNSVLHGFIGIPNVIMNIPMLLCALGLREKDIKFITILTVVECFFGMYEYSLGITSVLPNADVEYFGEENMLYYKRVFGLSNNSSIFSQKILCSILLIISKPSIFKKLLRWIIILIFVVGLLITFNRTAIAVVLLFFIIELFIIYRKNRLFKLVAIASIAFIVINLGIFMNSDLFQQFTRGDISTMLTGRPLIWNNYMNFIAEHPLGGNGSVHILLDYQGLPNHAHNSFLQVIADHGFILSLLYFSIIATKINRNNAVFCIILIISSLTQYILFWGFSFVDVLFFSRLCNKKLFF